VETHSALQVRSKSAGGESGDMKLVLKRAGRGLHGGFTFLVLFFPSFFLLLSQLYVT